jgi:hypothetical protein
MICSKALLNKSQLDNKWQGNFFVPVIDALFSLWQDDHCRKAYQWQIHLYQKGAA